MDKKIVTARVEFHHCPYTFEAFEVEGLVEVWCNALNPDECIVNLSEMPTEEELAFWGEAYLCGRVDGEKVGRIMGEECVRGQIKKALGL